MRTVGWTIRSMQVLKLIGQATVGLCRRAWLLPHAVAVGFTQRRRRFALKAFEVERLDRIRNPWKYLGK